MCGRYTLTYRDQEALARVLGIPPEAVVFQNLITPPPRRRGEAKPHAAHRYS